MQVIVSLIAIDVLLGVIAALVKKNFTLNKLADFMKGAVIHFVLGFAIVQMVGEAFPPLDFIVIISFIIIVIVLVASIFRNLSKLGIPVPNGLKR
jgi:phage-related holin